MKENNFGDYIIFADEAGDHNLTKVDCKFPIFSLALCLIKKTDYINSIVPIIQKLKFDYWGHDKIVLHERDIRKQIGEFAFLRQNKNLREGFLEQINKIILDSKFCVVSSVIKKETLNNEYSDPFNPYHIALKLCMERVLSILIDNKQENKKIFCIFEKRGKKEDEQLELEFYRIVNNQNNWRIYNKNFKKIDFEIKFAGKEHNSTGLQLADLLARPIGINVLNPSQQNRAYEIIKDKYCRGCENKVFP